MADKSRNIYEKILSEHLLEGDLVPGQEIGITIDQTLTQDATGTVAYLQLEALQVERVETELSVSYGDHNTVQQGYESADDHKYLETVASRYGILFSKPGNGICHQVHLERFARPGKTLLGSDSHTPTAGALGSLAIGAGGLDVALAMAGKPFYLPVPRVIKLELTGRLKPSVTAKDVILHALSLLTTTGNSGWAIEYAGDALKGLSIPMRATMANMGAETGVTTSIFPSDGRAREFLRKQGREGDWNELQPDEGAGYEKLVRIDLDDLEPLAAKPHSPDNVDRVENLQGLKVDQVCIGSCTNSSYEDLMMTAEILSGNKVHPRVSLVVAARSALKGEIANPAEFPLPAITPPERYPIDDSMVLQPRYEGEPVKGPNIGDLPRLDELPGTIDGVAAIKVGDQVTTDHIVPAGSRLKYRSNIAKYARYVFEGLDGGFVERAAKNRDRNLTNIIIAGVSYGQGSKEVKPPGSRPRSSYQSTSPQERPP
jgi:predicted aconitate hydratase